MVARLHPLDPEGRRLMPVEQQWANRLVILAQDLRPHGARRWDAPGILAAIRQVQHLALGDVVMAVTRAACDRSLDTPAAIANLRSSAWRERVAEPTTPTHEPFDRHTFCGTCGQPEARCRAHPRPDHDFETTEQRDARVARERAARQETP
jgi:hypothetical protein